MDDGTDVVANGWGVMEVTFRSLEYLPQPFGLSGQRLQAVLAVLYLIFNEGYTASSGEKLHRVDLSGEAIRLTRLLHRMLPADGEIAGLLALTSARFNTARSSSTTAARGRRLTGSLSHKLMILGRSPT